MAKRSAWVGLFTSYAPVVNPKLAVVVITRGSAGRSKYAAAIAGNIYRALSPRFGTKIDFHLALVHTLGDVSRFGSTRQITAFIGLDPVERSSGGKQKFGGVSKAGSPLTRFLLGQAANIASRFDPYFKSNYKRLAKKKPKAVAKTATARKLLVKLSIRLRDQITAQEFEDRGRTLGNARRVQGPK